MSVSMIAQSVQLVRSILTLQDGDKIHTTQLVGIINYILYHTIFSPTNMSNRKFILNNRCSSSRLKLIFYHKGVRRIFYWACLLSCKPTGFI